MLERLRKLFGKGQAPAPRGPVAAGPSLEGRPFTHALLARTVEGGDPERAVAKLGPEAWADGSFQRLVEDAALRTAVGLTRAAARRAELKAAWGPEEQPDDEGAAVVVFALFLALAIVGYLKQEGTPLKFDALAPEVARRFFQAQGPERAERYAQGALYGFQSLSAGSAPPLVHWRGRVARLTQVAVLRAGRAPAGATVEHMDPMPSLADLLRELVEGRPG